LCANAAIEIIYVMTTTDAKLERLAAAGLCSARAARELRELGRLSDLATVVGGEVLAREGGYEPWSYYVLDGTALLSSGDAPVAVAGAGAWLLGHVPGRARRASTVSVVAGSQLEVLAFRPSDLGVALDRVPDLARTLSVDAA